MIEILNGLVFFAAGVISHLVQGLSVLPAALSSIVLF